MKEYKNINSINEVKGVLEKFQEGYTNKETNNIDLFINEMFSSKDGLVVLGREMNQWAFNLEDTKKIIEKHWSKEDNYLKEMDFKFGEAKIFANENVALVVTIGNIRNTISEDEHIEEAIIKVKEILGREEKSKENALNAAKKIAITLREIEKGESYIWPFRFTGVLIKEKGIWKFHHMQFSFDSASWSCRFVDENYDKSVFEMSKANVSDEIEEIREVLHVFQEGYTKRDLNYVDEYIKKVFLLDEDLVVIGTDAEELCLGIDATRGIVASDWEYWGDFKMNVDGAIICVNGDVAYFTTKAILNRVVPNEKILQWISGSAKYTLEAEGTPKDKLMEVLCDTVDYLYENERGEIFITPMRFSGVLVKIDGKWLIQHAQYSDYSTGKPEVRI